MSLHKARILSSENDASAPIERSLELDSEIDDLDTKNKFFEICSISMKTIH